MKCSNAALEGCNWKEPLCINVATYTVNVATIMEFHGLKQLNVAMFTNKYRDKITLKSRQMSYNVATFENRIEAMRFGLGQQPHT